MTTFEKKIAQILLIAFGIFFAAIAIFSLILRFEVQPIYDLSLNYFSFERISGGLIILPGFLSVLCFRRFDKLTNKK